jgi:hypothetical protein
MVHAGLAIATIRLASETGVRIPVRTARGAAGGQDGLDLDGQVRAEVRSENRGCGTARVCGGVGHWSPPGLRPSWLVM